MRYIFACLLLLTVHATQAQVQLILFGARMATSAAIIAADKSKAGKTTEAAPAAASALQTTPFTYRGEAVSRRRTTAEQLKGKGTTEIMALEAALEESYVALGAADSVQSFLPLAHYDAIIAAARKAAAARTNWDYSAYQQELAFYQREEARRQQARDKPTTTTLPEQTH